jgi:multiple antibiotic resistance protein
LDGNFAKEFALAFVPLFVAIDAIGTLPIVLGLMEESKEPERVRIINIALMTAAVVGFAFLFLGKAVLRFLDIEVEHFAIAGGLVLLALALKDLTGTGMVDRPDRQEMIAVVPIGTPLTAGPGTLATLLLLTDRLNDGAVALAFIANIVAAWLTFRFGDPVARVLGRGGLKAMSKIANLLLAAIAIRLVVDGVTKAFDL